MEIINSQKLFVIVSAFLPSSLILLLLLGNYPNTGLGRIIAIPMILVMNLTVIIVGIKLIEEKSQQVYKYSIILIILITLFITILFYPQDGNHVITEIWEDILR